MVLDNGVTMQKKKQLIWVFIRMCCVIFEQVIKEVSPYQSCFAVFVILRFAKSLDSYVNFYTITDLF